MNNYACPSFSNKKQVILFKNLTWLGFGIDAWLNGLSNEKLAAIESNLWVYLSQNAELAPISKVFNIHEFQAAIENAVTNKMGKTLISLA